MSLTSLLIYLALSVSFAVDDSSPVVGFFPSENVNIDQDCKNEWFGSNESSLFRISTSEGSEQAHYTPSFKTKALCQAHVEKNNRMIQQARDRNLHIKIQFDSEGNIASVTPDFHNEYLLNGEFSPPGDLKCNFFKSGNPMSAKHSLGVLGCASPGLEFKMIECQQGDFVYSSQVICKSDKTAIECLTGTRNKVSGI